MSLPKSINKYSDIARDLHTMLDGGRRILSTPAKAQRWRMRAYMYRALLEEQYEQGLSPFSRMIFRITKAEPNVVTILVEPESDGWIEDKDGNRIEPAPQNGETAYVADPVDLEIRDAKYQAEMDVEQAKLKAAMRRPAPQTPPPTDISDSSGMDTTDPFGWNHKD